MKIPMKLNAEERKMVEDNKEGIMIGLYPLSVFPESRFEKSHPLKKIKCDLCKQDCWITPKQMEITKIGIKVHKCCVTCVDKLYGLDSDKIVELSTEE